MRPDEQTIREALHWATLTGDAEFDDWDGFTLWLERSPAHAQAYDEAVTAVENATRALEDRQAGASRAFHAANDDTDPDQLTAGRGWSLRWFGPALAASLAGLLAIGVWQFGGGDDLYLAPDGETLQIALDDGSTIALAGGGRLIVEDGGARRARLEQGQALFTIRHDESDPFVLVAGNDTLVDAGTIFDVRLGRGRLEVGVAEGAVIVNPQTRNVRLDPGQRLTLSGDAYAVEPVATDEIGEWTRGRITFRNAPLAEIADDLSRATGQSFSVTPGGDAAGLSGSIMLEPVRQDPRTLEPLLGVRVTQRGEGWVLSAS